MPTAPLASASLDDWLDYISAVNPREIELGLDRVARVWELMGAGKPGRKVITVAGTNGKGTCVAALESLLCCAGKLVGCYTSPHLYRFNERVRIAGLPVDDSELCRAFAAIDQARGVILLSYFEFATLAAFYLFREADVEVAVLEVGLGGRLDAVNIIDADVAVITSISLDHTDWLGDDLETIGREKAGIMRRGKPAICADTRAPASVAEQAAALGVTLYRLGHEFRVEKDAEGRLWHFQGVTDKGREVVVDSLRVTGLLPENLAAAMQALLLLNLLEERCLGGLSGLRVAGRLEERTHRGSGRRLLLDVAHNPAAARHLAARLACFRKDNPDSRVAAVLAVMADKDVESMTAALQTGVDIWYIAQVDLARCMPASEVAQIVAGQTAKQPVAYSTVAQALDAAVAATTEQDLVLVTGSFHTVAALDGLTEPLVKQ